ncbi:MAG: zinc ribbon domain-containing protein [Actinomycetota bacterium]|nr:zinc ribbon domain-containing protein [Actinomycetota bacterium]MDD5666733.1 zinc ribbon domain-containing protein [Actinomycetota bacterium]
MPRYDYKCEGCENVFETTHGVDDTVTDCPRCGGRVRRLFHPVGIIFKGSGFYKTDYGSASGNGGDRSSPENIGKEIEKVKEKGPGEKAAEKKSAGD